MHLDICIIRTAIVVESASRMYGGYPGLSAVGLGRQRATEREEEEDNMQDLSDDIDVETDMEAAPRLVNSIGQILSL